MLLLLSFEYKKKIKKKKRNGKKEKIN